MSRKSNPIVKLLVLVMALFLAANTAALAQTGVSRGQKNSAASTQPVNVNQATADQLTSLPGIGPAMAKRIVEFRQKNGPFKKVEDLLSVRGIGEKKLERMKTQILL